MKTAQSELEETIPEKFHQVVVGLLHSISNQKTLSRVAGALANLIFGDSEACRDAISDVVSEIATKVNYGVQEKAMLAQGPDPGLLIWNWELLAVSMSNPVLVPTKEVKKELCALKKDRETRSKILTLLYEVKLELNKEVKKENNADMYKVQQRLEKLAELDPSLSGNLCMAAQRECQQRSESSKLAMIRAKAQEKEQRQQERERLAQQREADKQQRIKEREEDKKAKQLEREAQKAIREIEKEAQRQQRLELEEEARRVREAEVAKLAPKIGGFFAKKEMTQDVSPTEDEGKLFSRQCWVTQTNKEHVVVASLHRRATPPHQSLARQPPGSEQRVKFLLFHQNTRPAYYGTCLLYTSPSPRDS
eukprot:TRINITY_DN25519_c0_g2_i1.p1 TRINITY_DN25519_c0_g2~~TRINITY_DN25519_c0_g2_i1.p1  ORF type:complete len:364 (+),score=97.16 TRINITY_DN25519_c0_g2_i1:195-1286(+)